MIRLAVVVFLFELILGGGSSPAQAGLNFGVCQSYVKKTCPKVKNFDQLAGCMAGAKKSPTSRCKEHVRLQLLSERLKRQAVRTGSNAAKGHLKKGSVKNPPSASVKSSDAPIIRPVEPVMGPQPLGISQGKPRNISDSDRRAQVVPASRKSSGLTFIVLSLAFAWVWLCVATAFLFKKMGLDPFTGAMPFYNTRVLLIELEKPEIWNIYLYIPGVNVYFGYLVSLEIIRRFSKPEGWAIACLLCPFIVVPYLTFGPDSYIRSPASHSTDFGPDFDLKELSRIMARRLGGAADKSGRGHLTASQNHAEKLQSMAPLTEQTIDLSIDPTKKSG